MTPAILAMIVELCLRYGPSFAAEVAALFKKDNVTADEVHALFANVKPYESYGIKDQQ